MKWGGAGDAVQAALWLCEQLGIDPRDLGYQASRGTQGSPGAGTKTGAGLASPDLVTEDRAAQDFAELYAGKLRYCHDTGAWFRWDGSIWRQNRTGIAFQWARELARELSASEA